MLLNYDDDFSIGTREVLTLKDRAHSEIISSCEECGGSGNVRNSDFCNCQIYFNSILKYLNCNIPPEYLRLKFSQLNEDYQKKSQKIFRRIMPLRDFINSGKGLFIRGCHFGIGKTTLAVFICKAVIDFGITDQCWFVNMHLFDRELYRFDDNKARNHAMDIYHYCKVLVLDGLGEQFKNFKGGEESWYVRQVLGILRSRRYENRSTIITTNLTKEKLQKLFGDEFFSLLGKDKFLEVSFDNSDTDNRKPIEA